MKDILIEEIEDLQLFADPFEEFKKSVTSNGWTATFVRKGEEIAVRRDSDGTIRTLRGPGQRKYRNLRGLLVSEIFANLGRLASAQMHRTRNLADPATGAPKDYLPNGGEIRCGDESIELTFDSVCERLEQREDRLRVFVVNGVAGVGKSHLIERIVRSRAVPASYKSGTPLLLHVESRGKVLTSLSDRIAGTLSSLRASFVEDELKPLIRRGAIQVAIDGFDELSDSRGYVRAWGALKDFIRDLRGQGTCVLAGRDTMLDGDAVHEGLGNTIGDGSVTFLHVQHPPSADVREWLSRRQDWRDRRPELNLVKRQIEESEYLRRPFFISQLADLGPDRFQDAQGEPIADLMDCIIRREAEKLTGVSSDIDATLASELYLKVLSETARMMVDDETATVEVGLLELLVEEVFSGYADQEMINALVQRAGALALLEKDAGEDSKRSFPHETVRSYFFAQNIFDYFPENGATVGLHRVPLSADDFRIFNRVARRKPLEEQKLLRERLRAGIRETNGYDYLRANIGGLLLSFAPLVEDDPPEDEPLVLASLELTDVWMADLLGTQQVSMVGCGIHRLDVRGADLRRVHFSGVRVNELLADPFVRFGTSVPTVNSLVLYRHFREVRWGGVPSEWIEQKSLIPERSGPDPDERWYLLERLARLSMRQYAVRTGNRRGAVRKIFDSPHWPALRELLQRHGRLQVLPCRSGSGWSTQESEDVDVKSAPGPKTEWLRLVAAAEFLNPESANQDSTRKILEELNVGVESESGQARDCDR